MATQIHLTKIWGDSGGSTDPGGPIYTKGWVREIPTFQKFNYVLGNCTINILVKAEQDFFSWQPDIKYNMGAVVYYLGIRYTCRADTPIGIAPENDPSGSLWHKGNELRGGERPVLTPTDTGISISGQVISSSSFEITRENGASYAMENSAGSASMTLDGNIYSFSVAGKSLVDMNRNAGLLFKYNGSTKLETISTGAKVTGNMAITGDISGQSHLINRKWFEDNVLAKEGVNSVLEVAYPVGSIYMSALNNNPGNNIGGTWVAFSQGRTIVGRNAADSVFKDLEQTGGAKKVDVNSHTHVTSAAGSHRHLGGDIWHDIVGTKFGRLFWKTFEIINGPGLDINITPYTHKDEGLTHTHTISTEGVVDNTNNMMPYQTIYMWKRTA